MSSYPRTLQRAFKRGKHYQGRGRFLGIPIDPHSPEYQARIAREAKRALK